MNTNHSQDLSEKAVAAMKAAVRGVVEDHRRRRRPLASWENGKVVEGPAIDLGYHGIFGTR